MNNKLKTIDSKKSELKYKRFQKTLIATSISACVMVSGGVIAAEQTEVEETIQVRGVRGALMQSVDIKRESIGIVEAITADDIGKMPDQNIAESLQRVTGVQIDRGPGGEGTRVRIRGMGNNLTLLNGETFTTGLEYYQAGEGRNELRDSLEGVPAELLGGVEVYKSPTASLIEGGAGGVINMKTRDPLSLNERLIAGSVKLDRGSTSGEVKPLVTIVVGDKLNEDFAVIASLSMQKKLTQANEAQNINRGNWGFVELDNGDYYISQGMQYETEKFLEKDRLGASLGLGWQVSDKLKVNVDWFHTKLDLDSTNYVMKYDVKADAGRLDQSKPYTIDDNSVLLTGNYVTAFPELNTSREIAHIKTDNFKVHAEYEVSDTFSLSSTLTLAKSTQDKDAAYADVWAQQYRQRGPDANSPTGFTQLSNEFIEFGYENNGGDFPLYSFDDANSNKLSNDDDYRYKSHWAFADDSEADSSAFKVDGTWLLDNGPLKQIKAGFRVASQKIDMQESLFLSDMSQNGGSVAPNYDLDNPATWDPNAAVNDKRVVIQASDGRMLGNNGDIDGDGIVDALWGSHYYFIDSHISDPALTGDGFALSGGGTVNLGELVYGVSGGRWDGTAPNVVPWETFAENPDNSINRTNFWEGKGGIKNGAWFHDAGKMGNAKEWIGSISNAPVSKVANPVESWSVEYKTNAFYVEADLEWDLLTVNLGARVVRTKQIVGGGIAGPSYVGSDNWNGTIIPSGTFQNEKSSTEILPSINANYELSDDQYIRVSAAKVISRPDMQTLGKGLNLNYTQQDDRGGYAFISGSAGNPDLEQFEATQLDVSYEWYFDDISYFAAGLFYKDIASFISSREVQETHSDSTTIGDGNGGNPGESTAGVTRPFNGDGGKVKGLELAYQKGFENGLGFVANYTYSDSTTNLSSYTNSDLGLTGVSKTAYNLIGFYEANGINARIAYSWRDKYLAPFSTLNNIGAHPADGEEVVLADFYKAYGQLDASVAYDINDNLSISLEAINLGKESQNRYAEYENLFRSYEAGETRYVAGISFRY